MSDLPSRDPERAPVDKLFSWLDDDTSPVPESDVTKHTPPDCLRIADELVVHGLLEEASLHDSRQDERRIQNVLAVVDEEEPQSVRPTRKRARMAITAGLIAMTACVLVAVTLFEPAPVSASVALERLIETASESVDRAYRITILEEYSQRRRPQNLPEENWNVDLKESLDGAMLYVGGVNRFVFVRELTDGRQRVSGCDGHESWAFCEDGPVHVSHDLMRFRGGLPGQRQDLGFTDLYSLLNSLRDGYEIVLQTSDAEGGRLVAERKSNAVQGPKSVEIGFDAESGMIRRMVLDGLPRGRGGPKSVEFALVSQNDVADDFYSHGSHHDAERRIRQEASQQ